MSGSIFFTVEVKQLAGASDSDPTAWHEWERYDIARTAMNRARILKADKGWTVRCCRVHVMPVDLDRDPDNVIGVGIP